MNKIVVSFPLSVQPNKPQNENQTQQILQVVRQLIFHARMFKRMSVSGGATLSGNDAYVLAEAITAMAEKLESARRKV